MYYCFLCEKEHKKKQLLVLERDQGLSTHLRNYRNDKEGNPVTRDAIDVATLFTIVNSFSLSRLGHLSIRCIVYCHVAFRMVENHDIKDRVIYLNKERRCVPRAASAIRGWILPESEKHKEEAIMELGNARGEIHLSFNLGTVPDNCAIVGVSSHFIDCRRKRRTDLLSFRRDLDDHKGDSIGAVLLGVKAEYSIGGRIGYDMADNGSNNDTSIDVVMNKLHPTVAMKWRKVRRLRCLAHITKLIAKAMLLGMPSKGSNKAMKQVEF